MLYCKDFIGKRNKYVKVLSKSLVNRNIPSIQLFSATKSIPLLVALTILPTHLAAQTCSKFINSSQNNFSESANVNEYYTVGDAIENSVSGDVICFRSGIYSSIHLDNINGGENKLTLQAEPNSLVEIKSDNYKGTGIKVTNSKDLVISGFKISGGLYGIYVKGSSDVALLHNNISDVGQEAISIKSGYSKQPLANFSVNNNVISDTGKTNSQYGEGIYIGDGNNNYDEILRNVEIKDNHITNVSNEAIDIKINVSNINIRSNTIIDTNLKFNGAITVATANRFGEDAQIKISHNLIRGVTNRLGYSSVGIAVGQGNALIDNNVIIESGTKFIGICLYSTFMNNVARKVTINNNDIMTDGRAIVTRCSSGGTGEKEYADATIISSS